MVGRNCTHIQWFLKTLFSIYKKCSKHTSQSEYPFSRKSQAKTEVSTTDQESMGLRCMVGSAIEKENYIQQCLQLFDQRISDSTKNQSTPSFLFLFLEDKGSHEGRYCREREGGIGRGLKLMFSKLDKVLNPWWSFL